MLEHLFGSRTRLKLLQLFLMNQQKKYYVRELSRLSKEHMNSVRRELENLEQLGFLQSFQENKKKFYSAIEQHPLYSELKALIYKERVTSESALVEGIKNLGKVYYLALFGMFVEDHDAPTDVFVVGKVNRAKLKELLSTLQLGFESEIHYTLFSLEEYVYRKEIADKFVAEIMQRKKIVVIDELQPKKTTSFNPSYESKMQDKVHI